MAAGKGAAGRPQLYIDRNLAGEADFPYTTLFFFNPGSLVCGASGGSPVVSTYRPPFNFTGKLHQVIIDLSGDLITDDEAETRMVMARQ